MDCIKRTIQNLVYRVELGTQNIFFRYLFKVTLHFRTIITFLIQTSRSFICKPISPPNSLEHQTIPQVILKIFILSLCHI